MNRQFIYLSLIALAITVSSTYSCADKPSAEDKFYAALEKKIGKINKSEELQISITPYGEPVCGGSGSTLVADLKIRRAQKELDEKTGSISIKSVYESIKSYSVPLEDAENLSIKQLAKSIMSDDECLE